MIYLLFEYLLKRFVVFRPICYVDLLEPSQLLQLCALFRLTAHTVLEQTPGLVDIQIENALRFASKFGTLRNIAWDIVSPRK